MRLAIVVLGSWVALGCGNKDSAPAPVSSSTSTSVAPLPEAPESPLAVVLESKSPITFSGLGGGVVIADQARTTLAMATFNSEISVSPMPTGLPTEGRILRFSGRVPGSIWVTFEEPGKSAPKNPFLRLDGRKKAFKQYADDWKPLLAAWSNRRILSMSTSSGKLKIKVIEPSQDKPLPDWPSPALNDEACAKSLKVEALTALPTGEAFASGTCKSGDSGRRHVIVRWPDASATDTLDAGIADASIADASIVDAGNADASIADSGTNDIEDGGSGSDGGEAPVAPVGIPGEVFAIAGGPGSAKHLSLVARTTGDAWLLRSDETTSFLHRLEASTVETQPLPTFQGPARALASTNDGTLWLLSGSAIWKRNASGAWEEIPPPTRAFPEPDPRWEMIDVWAVESDVWITAKHSSSKATRYVVLRQRAAKNIVQWP